MKKLIKCGAQFMNLDGEPITDDTVVHENGIPRTIKGKPLVIGKILATQLMQAKGEGDDMKIYLLAVELNKGKDLKVDQADFQTLEKAIDKLVTNRITKAQMQLMMSEAKELKD